MEAPNTWLPTNSDFDTNNVMKLPDLSVVSIPSSIFLATIKNWTATKSQAVLQLRRELEIIREQHPDLYEALAKDNPGLIT